MWPQLLAREIRAEECGSLTAYVCVDQYAVASTVQFDVSTPDGLIKQQMADVAAGAWNAAREVYLDVANLSLFALGGAEVEGGAVAGKVLGLGSTRRCPKEQLWREISGSRLRSRRRCLCRGWEESCQSR